MFDIGFPELMLVSIVALLVIGPERLPETIRTIMLWLGRIRRTFTNIKTELEQEIGADEIRRQLHNETILKEIKESKNQISDALKDADQSIQEFKHSVTDSANAAPKQQEAQQEAQQNQSATPEVNETQGHQKTDEHDSSNKQSAP
jgi:sec-independent protein translocase protein TatB